MPILPHLKASCAFVVLFMATSSVSHGQESKPATKTTFGLPPTAFVAIRMKPQQYLHSDSATWMPIEIAQAWSDENLGLDLQSVELVTAFVGMPMGPGAPPIAIHIALSKDFDPSRINPKLLLEKQSRKIQDKEVYMLGDRNDHMMLHAINPRSMVIADHRYNLRSNASRCDYLPNRKRSFRSVAMDLCRWQTLAGRRRRIRNFARLAAR